MSSSYLAGSIRRVRSYLPAYPIGPSSPSEPLQLTPGDFLIVLDNYELISSGGAKFTAVAYVCKFGVKDCHDEDFKWNTTPILDSTDES